MVRWLCAVGVLGLSGCTPAPKGAAVEPVAAVAADQTEVSLLLVGDTSVARGVAELINGVEAENKPAHGAAFPFELIAPLLHAHDLVFANLECVLSDSNAEEALKTYRIRAPTQNAQALHDVGIDVVSVANNHAADFGVQGMTSTLQTLKDEGVIAVGAQLTPGWAQPPTIVQVGIYRVGFLAYNQHGDEYGHDNFRPAPAQYDIDDVIVDVSRARALVDFLIVSVHGGRELSYELSPWQEADARAVIDAGADVWIGHHPHVVQPWTRYHGKVIAWSLGDFVFDKQPPWLVARNNPRLFLAIKLHKDSAGHVVADANFIAGAQHPKTWQPLVPEHAAFDVDSFALTPLLPTFRDLLRTAVVERVRAGSVSLCDRWEKHRIGLGLHAFRWLAPRFACDDEEAEKLRPWETVANSAELFQGSLKHGIWAHPHANGVLRIRFPNIKLGSSLQGFAGFPDWQITLKDRASKRHEDLPAAAVVRVLVADSLSLGEASSLRRLNAWARHDGVIVDTPAVVVGAVEALTTIPCEGGTSPLQLDTSSLKGTRHDVVVEVSGGSGDREGRFLFDLAVVP